MNFNSLVNKMAQLLEKNVKLAQKQVVLFKEIYQMVEAQEPDIHIRKDIESKFKDLTELVEYNAAEKIMKIGQIERREQLLAKYQAEDVPEAIVKVVGPINEQYNPRDTDEARWLDLRVQLSEYSAKNDREVKGLEELENAARHLRSSDLAEELKNSREKLIEEEKVLQIIVEKLNPEEYKARGEEDSFLADYEKTAKLIQKRLSLYSEKGRTDLMKAYNGFIKDYDDSSSMRRMWIEAADKYCQKRNLEELTKSALAGEAKPGAETLRRSAPQGRNTPDKSNETR